MGVCCLTACFIVGYLSASHRCLTIFCDPIYARRRVIIGHRPLLDMDLNLVSLEGSPVPFIFSVVGWQFSDIIKTCGYANPCSLVLFISNPCS